MDQHRERRVRRYARLIQLGMVVLCSGLLLGGLGMTGVRLEEMVRMPERFNPIQDICVRLAWVKVVGDDERVRLCAEWIQLSDPSGETHKIQQQTHVVKSADGKLYFDDGKLVDDRLFLVVALTGVMAAAGAAGTRYLITRYRMRLASESAGSPSSSS